MKGIKYHALIIDYRDEYAESYILDSIYNFDSALAVCKAVVKHPNVRYVRGLLVELTKEYPDGGTIEDVCDIADIRAIVRKNRDFDLE